MLLSLPNSPTYCSSILWCLFKNVLFEITGLLMNNYFQNIIHKKTLSALKKDPFCF